MAVNVATAGGIGVDVLVAVGLDVFVGVGTNVDVEVGIAVWVGEGENVGAGVSVGNSTASGVCVAVGNDWTEVTIGAEGVEFKAGGLVVPTQAVSIIVTAPARINAPRGIMSHCLYFQLIGSRYGLNKIYLLAIY
ncbi:MAG: hypothetical protein IH861_00430 [Chloroflexi bacterium]|nr:hypothetical protein [Chloroflexota bacterium]